MKKECNTQKKKDANMCKTDNKAHKEACDNKVNKCNPDDVSCKDKKK